MILKSLHVCWFHSIVDEILECTQLTALLGPNGSGKSSFLRALDLFYAPHPRFTTEDFYAGDTSRNIEIEVTFTALTAEEQERFGDYLGPEGLRVARVFSLRDGKPSNKCYGYRAQNPDFLSIRAAANATEQKRLYQQLCQQDQFAQLPRWTRKEDALLCLENWEREHLDCCTLERDSGDFFCFDKGDPGDLTQYTRFIFIPAVRDAATDATEGKGAAITELMDVLVRNALANRDDITNLKADFQQRYDDIFNRESLPEVTELETQLTRTLTGYVPSANVTLSLRTNNIVDIPMPRVEVHLIEDGYSSDITRKGHGFQRGFILTVLQHLAVVQPPVAPAQKASEMADEDQQHSTLILAIEEPELYQHPARQRHFAGVLSKLAGGNINGVAHQTQVLYCTHSPLFVSVDWFNNLRLLRKTHTRMANMPKMTTVTYSNLNQVAELLWNASDRAQPLYTGDSLRPRLHSLMTPWMNEGFFAEVVVLVEGEDDRAAVHAVATLLEYDLESQGICVIPCNGKSNLGKAAAIFKSLEIPTYVIWDSDYGSLTRQNEIDRAKEENHCLLRLMGRQLDDWPKEVSDTYACFESNLESTLKQQIGEAVFDQLIKECQREFDIPQRKQAIKNPMVISALLQKAKAMSHGSKTLEQIFHNIIALRSGKGRSKGMNQLVTADVLTDEDATKEYAFHAQPMAVHADSRF